jgi:hypothetical protein
MTGQRYLIVTVDTEALPKRTDRDHVDRLIWGRFGGEPAGIAEMTAIAKALGTSFTFFVDMCEVPLYGQAIDDVARWLAANGQDVQLHMHPEVMDQAAWRGALGRDKPGTLQDRFDADTMGQLMDHWTTRLKGLTGRPVLAYRAGSYRWSANTIRALDRCGVPLSFNHSFGASLRGKRFVHPGLGAGPYRWEGTGVIEVPCTEHMVFGSPGSFSFPPSAPWWQRPFLRRLVDRDRRSLTVLDLHSWSFLHFHDGRFHHHGTKRTDAFRRMMDILARRYRIISCAELLDLTARGEIPLDVPRPLSDVEAVDKGLRAA